MQLDIDDSLNATAVGPGEECQIALSLLRSTDEDYDNLHPQDLLEFFVPVVSHFGFNLEWSVTYSDQIGMNWKAVYRLMLEERSQSFMLWVQYVKTIRLEETKA